MRGAIKHTQRSNQCNPVGITSMREGCGKEVGAHLMRAALKPNQRQSEDIRARSPPRLQQMTASMSTQRALSAHSRVRYTPRLRQMAASLSNWVYSSFERGYAFSSPAAGMVTSRWVPVPSLSAK